VALLVVLAPVATAATACARRATRDECERMLDKYVDMKLGDADDLRAMPPAQAGAVRATRLASAKAHPAYKKVAEACPAEVRRRQYDCAMAARNPDEWEACVD
jgi:hypothetical protein